MNIPKTISELCDLARRVIGRQVPGEAAELAQGVIDLLAEAQPHHLEDLEIIKHSTSGERLVFIPTEWGNRAVGAEDAAHMARMLLRAVEMT